MAFMMGVVCALTTVLQPISLEREDWMRDVIAFANEEQVIIAVVPRPIYTMEEKAKVLTEYAKCVSIRTGKTTVVTQDLSLFMAMTRMKKRGFDRADEERLLSKLTSIQKYCYII